MNKSRSNKARLFGKRNVKGLLPVVPCSILIEPWWRVEAGLILEDDIKVWDCNLKSNISVDVTVKISKNIPSFVMYKLKIFTVGHECSKE